MAWTVTSVDACPLAPAPPGYNDGVGGGGGDGGDDDYHEEGKEENVNNIYGNIFVNSPFSDYAV